MHYDDVCLLGTGCITTQGNRNSRLLRDHHRPQRAAEIIYDDTSNASSRN